MKIKRFAIVVVALAVLGGCGGGDSSSETPTTRGFVGTIASTTLNVSSQVAPGKAQTLCTDVQVKCVGYNGSETTADVDSDCSFRIELPLGGFCYCGVFTTSNGFLGTTGCEENGEFEASLPIFLGPDNETGDVNLGDNLTIDAQGRIEVNALCEAVDQDDDGISDAEDTDDDGDSIADGSDSYNEDGCEDGEEFDGDDNSIPDVFEASWDSLTDADSDNIPNFCDFDIDGDGEDNDADSDDDGDGTADDVDDDDNGDEIDDSEDADDDGVADFEEFEFGEDEAECSDSAPCDNDFECQLFADDDQTDEFETDNVTCNVSSGCCELM